MFAPLVAVALVAQSISVTAGVSTSTERTRFRFDNPSRFDTAELVPHFFEQKYETPPLAFFAQLSFGTSSHPSSTRISLTPRRNTRGSDIDTFFQPSGDVATSGTDGPITLGGFAADQRIPMTTVRGWRVDAAFGYRRDRAEFLPDDRVVTHTQPASVARTFITDRETTIAQVMRAGAAARRTGGRGDWRSEFEVSADPVVASRLLIRLPDKYPGVDLIYSALSFGGGVAWTLEREARGWRAGVTVSASGVAGYRRSPAYAAHRVGVDVFVGRRR